MTVRTDIEDRYAWVVNTSLLGSSFVLVIGLIVHIVLAERGARLSAFSTSAWWCSWRRRR